MGLQQQRSFLGDSVGCEHALSTRVERGDPSWRLGWEAGPWWHRRAKLYSMKREKKDWPLRTLPRGPPSHSTLSPVAPGSGLTSCSLPCSTFVPSLVSWINRFFFWLLFSSRVENIAISYKIFNYECRFKQHVQDWAIPM